MTVARVVVVPLVLQSRRLQSSTGVVGQRFLELVNAEVPPSGSGGAQAAGLQDGDQLTAFALWCHGGNRVLTWPEHNRDNSPFGPFEGRNSPNLLRNVQQVQATDEAFAAIHRNGIVFTWGDSYSGGSSSAVQDQLRNVQQLQAADSALLQA